MTLKNEKFQIFTENGENLTDRHVVSGENVFLCKNFSTEPQIEQKKKIAKFDSDDDASWSDEEAFDDEQQVSVRKKNPNSFSTIDFLSSKIDEEEEKAIQAFMSDQPRRLLGDIIAEKQAEQKHGKNELDPRITSLYEQVGQILSQYRSGKVPKAFKVIAGFANWEQVRRKNRWKTKTFAFFLKILLITQPDRWTAASMYQATRLFASNMDPKMAQRFGFSSGFFF